MISPPTLELGKSPISKFPIAVMGVDQDPKLAVAAASDDSDHEVYTAPRPVSRFTRWFRSPLFNVIIVGLISFTQPGIWNALNNTGASGQQEPYLVNGANSLTFGCVFHSLGLAMECSLLTKCSKQADGVRLSAILHFGKQIRTEEDSHHRYPWICPVLSILVCQQSIWNRMVCSLQRRHLWDCCISTLGYRGSNCSRISTSKRPWEVQ